MASKVAKTPSYQLRIELMDLTPPIWREVVVPGHWHLGLLHRVVQWSMGWDDSHLHEFEAEGVRYGAADPMSGSVSSSAVARETTVRLHEVLPAAGSRLFYTYDFGADWRHEIVVEALGHPAAQAACLAGERACPPEDSGGPWGYPEMLAAVKDPGHPEHETYVEWLGAFDPEAFDLARTDALLRQLG